MFRVSGGHVFLCFFLQGHVRRATSPVLMSFAQHNGGWKSQTLPSHSGRLPSRPPTSQRVTWSSYNATEYARSMSFPGDAVRNWDETGRAVPSVVKRESGSALPSCVFSRGPPPGSKPDVSMPGDDLQSFITQALEEYPSNNPQASSSTDKQTAFDLLEEVMWESQPEMMRETQQSMRINQEMRRSDPVSIQQAKSLPSSPQQLRHSMFEDRGRLVVASNMSQASNEAPVHYYSQQVDARHNQAVAYRQPVSTTVSHCQQPIIDGSTGSVQSAGFMLPFGQQSQTQQHVQAQPMLSQHVQGQHVQGQHVQGQQLQVQRQQPSWQLHQEIGQCAAPRELEKHRQQLQRSSAPGGMTAAIQQQQQQPQIAIQPPSAVAFSHMGSSNNGMMQMSDQSFPGRNRQLKAPRHGSFPGWPPSLPSNDMFGTQSRDRSNSFHGQSSKLSVPYPTRPLTPPLRSQSSTVISHDVSSSLASTMPFSHFLPQASAPLPGDNLSNHKGSTGSITNIVNSLLDRDATHPVDLFSSATSLQNDSELEFDRILSDPPSGFDLLREIGNCVDDSMMDIGTTA